MNKISPKEKRRLDRFWSKEIRSIGHCEICLSIKNLNTHHILDKRFYPEYRFEKDNLICLCVKCHKFGKYSAHKNPVFFANWLRNFKPEQCAWVMEHL